VFTAFMDNAHRVSQKEKLEKPPQQRLHRSRKNRSECFSQIKALDSLIHTPVSFVVGCACVPGASIDDTLILARVWSLLMRLTKKK
jgi:hypothetical protein